LKIAILLPEIADLGSRRRARQLAMALSDTQDPDGVRVEVVLGLPRLDEEVWRQQEQELRAGWTGCVVRHLGWERVGADLAKRMYPSLETVDTDGISDVVLPRDWGWNFVDCDAWIVLADAGLGAVMPVKPTAYYIRDLAQRYVPEGFASGIQDEFWVRQTDAFRLWRQSPCVFTTDERIAVDITSYAGVRRDRVVTVSPLPGERSKVNAGTRPASGMTILWLAEPDARHDVGAALDGIRLLFAEGARPRIVVAGEGAAAFANGGIESLAGVPSRALAAIAHLEIEVLASNVDIQRLLRRVDLVWGSALAQGENEALVRAAEASLPFVGLDYEQNRRFAEHLGVRATWYAASSAPEIADALTLAIADTAIGRSADKTSGARSKKPKMSALATVVERLWSGHGE